MSEQDELRQLRELVAQLTSRVYRLEQLAAGQSPAAAVRPAPTPNASVAPTPPARPEPEVRAEPPVLLRDSLERRIGSQWLNRVGVVAVLVGASYFLKLAFDNGWIAPVLRTLIGVLTGVGLCWWSERFRARSQAFSYSLKAVGIGILYLSLWASFQVYNLLPGPVAFLAMVLVTAATAWLAMAQDAELLAGLALLGGLLTPVLCSTHENHGAALFSYLLVLSLGAFVLQRFKPWPRILFGAFVGSFLLGAAWFYSYYSDNQFSESLLFFTLLFALFAVAPLYSILQPERDRPTRQIGLLLAILNAAAYFSAVYSQLLTSGIAVHSRGSAYALGLAVVYFSLAVALDRRVSEQTEATHPSENPEVERLLPIAHYGLAISFLTVAIALRVRQHWLTPAWLVEGALLFWAGARAARRGVKLFAVVVVFLGIFRLLTIDLYGWGMQSLIVNARFATFAVAIAALLWMIYLERQYNPNREPDSAAGAVAVVMVNLLVLLAIGLEIHDTFGLLIRDVRVNLANPAFYNIEKATHALFIARNFSYSALIMSYGALLMWLGFRRKSAMLRWQAILLIAVTILKVFAYDVSALDRGWRVLSFIILGALLLAVSYVYQRDWLGLQRPRSSV